jgi:hypothetical protein
MTLAAIASLAVTALLRAVLRVRAGERTVLVDAA